MKHKIPALALATLVFLSNAPVLASGSGGHSHENSQSTSSNETEKALLSGVGEVKRINQKRGKVTLKHGPIGSEMPGMTMEFSVSDPELLQGFSKGQKVSFKITKDMVITEIKLAGSAESPTSKAQDGHSDHSHDNKAEIGSTGEASNVSRTIKITMFDSYYEPKNLKIQEGETIRFIVSNKGELVHEFNISTEAMHKAHAPEMMMMVDYGVLEADRINWEAAKKMQASMGHGMHEEPNSVLLEPGKTGELIWKFPAHVDLQYACNVPGHYEAGMVGPVKLIH